MGNKEKCAQQIIEKLTTARPEVESSSTIEKYAVPKKDSPRGEYMRLIKKIKGKSNKEAFDDLEEDLQQMGDILQRIKYGGRNKNPYSAGAVAGFSAGSSAGFSARSSARSSPAWEPTVLSKATAAARNSQTNRNSASNGTLKSPEEKRAKVQGLETLDSG